MHLGGPRQDILSYVREIWIRVTTSKINEYRVFVALASVLQLYSSQTLILFGKFDMEQHILINIDRLCFLSPALEYFIKTLGQDILTVYKFTTFRSEPFFFFSFIKKKKIKSIL